MSKKALETLVIKQIAPLTIGAENKIASKVIRQVLQSKAVNQCLTLTNRSLDTLAGGLEKAVKGHFSTSAYKAFIKTKFFGPGGLHRPFPKGRVPDRVFDRLLTRNGLHLGKNVAYLGASYGRLKKIIHELNVEFLTDQGLSNYSRETFSNNVQYDHGTGGAAISMVGGVPAAMSIAAKELDPETLKDLVKFNFDAYVDSELSTGFLIEQEARSYRTLGHKVISQWANSINPKTGKFNANLSMIVAPIDKKTNLDAGNIEGVIYRRLMQSIADVMVDIDFLKMKGSSSINDKVANAIVVHNLVKKLKTNSSVRIQTNLDPNIKKVSKNTKHKVNITNKGAKPKKVPRRNKQSTGAPPSAGRSTGRTKANPALSLNTIMADIRGKLQSVVESKMTGKRLHVVSGEFSGSIEVGTPFKTPKGFINIPYRYQFSPYSVFDYATGKEPWNTKERDPDTLIDESIRQIVAGRLGPRFYTRKEQLWLK